MKIILVLGSIFISYLMTGFSDPVEINTLVVEQSNNGSIEGSVDLAVKSRGRRSGSGLYGRSARTAPESAPNDSVLVILSGSDSNNSTVDQVFLNQIDRQFKPGILPVRLGQTVRILNNDPVYHNVFSLTSPHKFDVGRRPKGEHYDVSFDKPGMVDVFCDIHSNMHAIIYVVPENAILWTKIAGGDSFSFENVPDGSYTLTFVALGYKEIEQTVNVNQGEVTRVGTITLNP